MTNQTRFELFCHPIYLAVAGGLNLPPFLFGVLGYATWCANFSSWLVANASLSLMNMLGALYIVYQIRKCYKSPYAEPNVEGNALDEDPEQDLEGGGFTDETNDPALHEPRVQTMTTNDGRRRTFVYRLLRRRTISSDRIRHLLCYDGVVATYSILFLFWIAWLSEGTQRLRGYGQASEEDREGCFEFHEQYARTSIVCGFSYATCVLIAMLGSLWK